MARTFSLFFFFFFFLFPLFLLLLLFLVVVELPSTDSLVRSTRASETGVFKKGFLFIFRFSPFVPLSSLFLNASWRMLSDSFSCLFTPRHATPHMPPRPFALTSPGLASSSLFPLPSLRNLSCLEMRDRCSEMEGGCNKRTNQRIRKGVCDMRLILRYCFRLLPRLVRPATLLAALQLSIICSASTHSTTLSVTLSSHRLATTLSLNIPSLRARYSSSALPTSPV